MFFSKIKPVKPDFTKPLPPAITESRKAVVFKGAGPAPTKKKRLNVLA